MIMIAGGGGFIGRNTARELVDRGQEVLLVGRRPIEVPSFLAPYVDKQIKLVTGDILELPFLYRLVKEYKIDSIIHMVNIRDVRFGSLYQLIRVNLDSVTEILEAAHIFGLRRVTFCSSVAVYGAMKVTRTLQEDMDLPVVSGNEVSAMKKAGEQICQLYVKEHGLSVPIVRPPLVYGPLGWSEYRPVKVMVENAAADKPADVSHVCGVTKEPFVYVRDCARAISLVHLAPSLKHNIYNISDSVLHSLADFAEMVKEVIPGAQIKLGTTKSEKDVDSPPMSIERIKEDVGFTPEYDIKRAVRAYIDWYKDEKYT